MWDGAHAWRELASVPQESLLSSNVPLNGTQPKLHISPTFFPFKKEKSLWRRPTLPRGHPPSTISADKLNCRVRDVTGCILIAPITKETFSQMKVLNNNNLPTEKYQVLHITQISPQSLVQVSSTHYCAYTPCLYNR